MKRILLSLLAILLTIMLIGCVGMTPSTPTPEVTAPSEQPPPTPEPTPEPEPKPAEFVVSNLQVIEPKESGLDYSITVDVENIGGTKGIYKLIPKYDDKETDIVEVELNPNEKKTIVLKYLQIFVGVSAIAYQVDKAEGKEHTISVDGLSQTIVFPEPEIVKKADLEIALSSDFSNPYMGIVFVKLTNVGNAPAKDIEIKVEFLDAQDNIIGIEELDTWDTEGIIIQPNKSESFEITTFSSKVIEKLDKYHAYVKWNSVK